MKRISPVFLFILCWSCAWPSSAADYRVKTVNFLTSLDLTVNGAGPLLVRSDPARQRTVLVNTQTSSVTIVGSGERRVVNIAIANRVPQHLKDEALAVDGRSGNVYVIGNRALHVVRPSRGDSVSIATDLQYEMVAVNGEDGLVYLVGRASPFLAIIDPSRETIDTVRFSDHVEDLANMNQTPPPPIRKVVWDADLKRVAVTDGFTSRLLIFDARGRRLRERKLALKTGARWHFAGQDHREHLLYIVIETAERRAVQAAGIDLRGERDRVVDLPGLTEAVGVCLHPGRQEIYIPYDNHPTVHAVSFAPGGGVREFRVPAYGNDASAMDASGGRLFVSSWAWSDICMIDVDSGRLVRRFRDLGVIPHMFSMDYNPADGMLYIPLGASAVNGSFGAAVTVLDPATGRTQKVRSGWAPVDLVPLAQEDACLVFNSEDRFARVEPDGSYRVLPLPVLYPNRAVALEDGTVNVAYGPHQSYWPVVYIWGAKNGVLGIDPLTMAFYDRRIPRMAQALAVSKRGVLFGLQNNWGGEKQFLFSLPDSVRSPNLGDMRVELDDWVVRETTQRILKYDPFENWLYIVRVGEKDQDPGMLQVYDIDRARVILNYPIGRTPVDLAFDRQRICVSNFDDDSVAIVTKADFSVRKVATARQPFKLVMRDDDVFTISHAQGLLQRLNGVTETWRIPAPGRVDGLFDTGDDLLLTVHDAGLLTVLAFDPVRRDFSTLVRLEYPYGETRLDVDNSAFFLRGQFGDGVFELNRFAVDRRGRIWMTDFLSGRVFIIQRP